MKNESKSKQKLREITTVETTNTTTTTTTTTGKPIEDAMHRSIRWLDRCIYAHKRPHDQFVIIVVVVGGDNCGDGGDGCDGSDGGGSDNNSYSCNFSFSHPPNPFSSLPSPFLPEISLLSFKVV